MKEKSSNYQIIIDKVDIYNLVSEYVNLTKVGNTYKGLSPFKDEKSPSFYVIPNKKMFKDLLKTVGKFYDEFFAGRYYQNF